MDSIVLQLQHDAMNSNNKLTDTLRKALLVATKLNLDDFKTWINCEMNGYPDYNTFPNYRKVRGELKAWNSYNGWIPVNIEDSRLYNILRKRNLNQPISELEAICNDENNYVLQIPFPHDILNKFFLKPLRQGMVPRLIINKFQLIRILDSVRNEIINWSLELEKKGIVGDGMKFSENEKKIAQSNINIEKFHGILGDVTNSDVMFHNYLSIHNTLKDMGVLQKERNELENILDDLNKADEKEKKSIAKKGLDWVTKNAPTIGSLSTTIKAWFDMLS